MTGYAAMLLAGCNIDAVAADIYARYTTGEGEVDGGGSGSAEGSVSSGGEGTRGGSTGDGEASVGGSGAASTETGAGTGTGSTSGGTAGTTGEPAVCGNGVQEEGEECDDGNDEDIDACDNGCAAAWTIFVTAYEEGGLGYTGKMNGLEGADTRCRHHALVAGLPRALKFKALLSDSTTDAADRLYHARGYYRLVNSLPVAHGWDALMNEPLENPVDVSELGTTGPYGVWTGTQVGGTKVPGAEHCGDWKVENDFTGHFGNNAAVDAGWLLDPNPDVNPTDCYASLSLYCVEQP